MPATNRELVAMGGLELTNAATIAPVAITNTAAAIANRRPFL